MVGRQWEDDLSGAGDDVTASLLVLDGTEKAEEIDEHDPVGELRLVLAYLRRPPRYHSRSIDIKTEALRVSTAGSCPSNVRLIVVWIT